MSRVESAASSILQLVVKILVILVVNVEMSKCSAFHSSLLSLRYYGMVRGKKVRFVLEELPKVLQKKCKYGCQRVLLLLAKSWYVGFYLGFYKISYEYEWFPVVSRKRAKGFPSGRTGGPSQVFFYLVHGAACLC